MSLRTWMLAMSIGASASAAGVIACSDDSPSAADAATCQCPAGEPPLAGRIMARTDQRAIAAMDGGSPRAVCNAGETILGGGCRLMTADGRITLSEAGIVRQAGLDSFDCKFTSASPVANTGIAEAICLVRAP